MAATTSPESYAPSTCPVDLFFDLDLALTTEEKPASGNPSPDSYVSGMPWDLSAAGICTVCMEEFGAGRGAKRMPCCHVYHDTCISTWLVIDRSCPLCRLPITF
ncbi:E3 ubiquitin-protein ligase RING1-like protein [Cinnamomum micranthum f. kanehirae]|uniref:E3 ubiquitin-protein ligase RING1-like protein n=1 Tax=Cinnamomum micranthum f. kanehirae TaxID=337451 RepID=A0A443N4R5_9MAGN|nr:E3 ubiquitin-protein ligase RING1-like protein [Cinnamomum micranthum f. kanehirae]